MVKHYFNKFKNYILVIPPNSLLTLDYILSELYEYPKEDTVLLQDFKNDITNRRDSSNLYKYLEGNKKIKFNITQLADKHFNHSLSFLSSKDLIRYDDLYISITYKGIIKKEKSGFVKEYKNKIYSSRVKRLYYILSLVALTISLCLVFF